MAGISGAHSRHNPINVPLESNQVYDDLVKHDSSFYVSMA